MLDEYPQDLALLVLGQFGKEPRIFTGNAVGLTQSPSRGRVSRRVPFNLCEVEFAADDVPVDDTPYMGIAASRGVGGPQLPAGPQGLGPGGAAPQPDRASHGGASGPAGAGRQLFFERMSFQSGPHRASHPDQVAPWSCREPLLPSSLNHTAAGSLVYDPLAALTKRITINNLDNKSICGKMRAERTT